MELENYQKNNLEMMTRTAPKMGFWKHQEIIGVSIIIGWLDKNIYEVSVAQHVTWK